MHLVEEHLRELLYSYECVTIPGLGGFIMQQHPAKITRDKSRIFPPGRVPSFNSLLAHDDGLLISSIARAKKVPYHEAALVVKDFVNQSNKKLALNEIITLDNIGELKTGPEGSLQFHQSLLANFLPTAYGMESLNLVPLLWEQPIKRTTAKPKDRKTRANLSHRPASVKWTLILSAPVILFLIYGIIFPSSVQTLYSDFSQTVPGMLRLELLNRSSIRENEFEPVMDAKTVVEFTAPELNESPSLPSEPEDTAPQPETIIQPVVARYHIIGGCFENLENAGKFLAGLKAKGFQAEEAGYTNRGHLRISYMGVENKTEALAVLKKIKTEENPDAWLLKY